MNSKITKTNKETLKVNLSDRIDGIINEQQSLSKALKELVNNLLNEKQNNIKIKK